HDRDAPPRRGPRIPVVRPGGVTRVVPSRGPGTHAYAGDGRSERREALRLAPGADRGVRRARQLRRDVRRVVVHEPLRDLLPRARYPDQQTVVSVSRLLAGRSRTV